MKKLVRILCVVFLLLMLFPTSVFASTPYTTFTYSIDGDKLASPDAYVPDVRISANDIKGLKDKFATGQLSDIEADEEGNIYLTDKKGNRIIVLDKFYQYKYEIKTFLNFHGVSDDLNSPSSAFVVNNGDMKGLYICDTGNSRIVVFDTENGEFIREIKKPESQLFGENAKYEPTSCVVDKYGRIYVASQTTTEGIIVLTSDGDFINFIGAPKVTLSAIEAIIKKMFPSAADELAFIPTTYTNLDLDKMTEEFVYGTIIFNSEEDIKKQIEQITSKTADYSPVKLLNAKGSDIMQRNGFFAPSGEVNAVEKSSINGAYMGVSNIQDISSGPNGVWSIVENSKKSEKLKRFKIYTYDRNGNLLYAFGDSGQNIGNLQSAQAVTYQGSNLIVLDTTSAAFIVYRRTEYGDILDKAIAAQNSRDYEEARKQWELVLSKNNNFDTAYVEIGKALYRENKYSEAIENFKVAYDKENYALAFKEVRREFMAHPGVFLGLIAGVVLIIFIIVKVFKYAAKVNKAAQLKVGKKSFKEEFLYGFHIMFHPFDGYWDLKHEQRGSVRTAIVIIAITVGAFYYQSIGTGYYYNPYGVSSTIFMQLASVLIPLGLFILANWCFTTLFDGEGSLKQIFVSSAYALYPLPVLVIVSTILTNFLVADEGQITTILVAIGYIWMAMLLILGMQVIHDYTMGKNIVTIIFTIVGIVFMIFIALLFISLISKMSTFVSSIVSEISYR